MLSVATAQETDPAEATALVFKQLDGKIRAFFDGISKGDTQACPG